MTVVVLFLVALVTSQLAAGMRAQARLAAGPCRAQRDHRRLRRAGCLSCSGERGDRRSRLRRADRAVRLQRGAGRRAARRRSSLPRVPEGNCAHAQRLRRRGADHRNRRAGRARHDRGFSPPNGSFTRFARARTCSRPSAWRATTACRRSARISSSCSTTCSTRSRSRSSAPGSSRRRASSPACASATGSARPCSRRSAGPRAAGRIDQPGRPSTARAARRSTRRSSRRIAAEALKLDRYISNLLELGPEADQQPIEAGGVTIDLFQRTVSKDGEEVHLTPKEYAVLAELAKHPGRVLTHAHLATHGLGAGAGRPDRLSARRHPRASAEAGSDPVPAATDPQ